MYLVIILIISAGVVAFCIISAAWALILVIPYYSFVGVSLYVLWRHRKQTERADLMARYAEHEKQLNAREFAAWRATIDADSKEDERR